MNPKKRQGGTSGAPTVNLATMWSTKRAREGYRRPV
jgi:hypothetical protein